MSGAVDLASPTGDESGVAVAHGTQVVFCGTLAEFMASRWASVAEFERWGPILIESPPLTMHTRMKDITAVGKVTRR